jgi:hypothetical protein
MSQTADMIRIRLVRVVHKTRNAIAMAAAIRIYAGAFFLFLRLEHFCTSCAALAASSASAGFQPCKGHPELLTAVRYAALSENFACFSPFLFAAV